jgi:hypothetical protein
MQNSREERRGDKHNNRSAGTDLPPVLPERQSVLILRKGLLPDIVVPLPQVARGGLDAEQISQDVPEAC